MDWLGTELYGNTARLTLTAAGAFVAILLAFRLVRSLVLERLRVLAAKTDTRLDDLVVELLQMIRSPEQYLLAFYLAARIAPLHLPAWLDKGLRAAVVVALTYRAVTLLQRVVAFAIAEATSQREGADSIDLQTGRTLTLLANTAVWALAVLFALSNLGFDITSMIAGLGIGGIAVALAAQAVLGDLFSAIAIWLDRPFEVGDAIAFDGHTGTVEEIGIKTTRVRSVSGELLIVPNAGLTSAKIRNFKRMTERRVAMTLAVAYKTPRKTLERIPGIIEGIVRSESQARLERVHLDKLGESSIDFELAYWVLTADYARHMDIKQNILLAILEAFESEKIEIPFPHRTVLLEKDAA